MKINVTKKFASSEMTIQVEDSDEKKALAKALIFTQPDKCKLCGSEAIRWDSNTAQTDEGTFIYVKRICRKCGAQSNLSSYKAGGYFWKEWEKYERKQLADTQEAILEKQPDKRPDESNLKDLSF